MKILKRIKRIACSSKSRNQVCTGTNNLPPLRFHAVHGENVKISADGAIARRVESFCKAIAFSNRPIHVNERVYLKFVDISSSWSGAVRFGFTSNDPVTYRNNLPKYACPDLKNKPGNWAKALPERLARRDSILCFYVNEDGELFYSLNGEDKGVFISNVHTNTPLWAIVDVYGNTCALEFIDPQVNTNNVISNDLNLLAIQLSRSSISRESREPLPQVHPNVQFQELQFHQNTPQDKGKGAPITFSECTVCCDKPINCVLYICGHMCMCYDCALKQWKGRGGGQCPICRAMIQDVIRTYLS